MSHTLHSPFQNSLLCAFGRPHFCFKRFYYTIRNSLMWISSEYTSFGGNCNKNFVFKFARLKNLKTLVNWHPIGCHTRCIRHSKIIITRYYYTIRNSLMWISSEYTSFGGNCNKNFFFKFARLKNARELASYRMSHTLHSPF